PAAKAAHDLLDATEVRLVLHAPIDVHGDVTRLALVGGREERVVAGDEAHFNREADVQPAPVDEIANGGDGRHRIRAWDGVLHLDEAHEAGAGEHVVTPVDH